MNTELYGNTPARLNITPHSAGYLKEVAKWGRFLAIVGFVAIGLVVAGGLFAGAAMSTMFLPQESAGTAAGSFFTFFYLLFALLYFFPVLYLYRFSGGMQEALRLQNEDMLTVSFSNLKSLFKFVGVLTIIVLAFYALGLLFMFLGVGIGAMM
ncbi:DUF5362 family protein [Pontibacter kalidii]|uniref:DUF5362 family protein n=1 Tax=Pontibacter kalidii TaxID=2592049 RepID=UPI00225ADD93|nr:DUF5362 family protein [Pontibacter kalidii]